MTFMFGPAGSGKSTRIHEWSEASNVHKTAVTGVAALNIDGPTIHSLLHCSSNVMFIKNANNGKLKKRLSNLIKFEGLEHLVIDEAPMAGAPLVYALHKASKDLDIGITFVGDPYQLGPVNAKPLHDAKDAWEEVKDPKNEASTIITLDKIWRQEDSNFIEFLMNIRRGNTQDLYEVGNCFSSKVQEDFPGMTLFYTNKDVNAFNLKRRKQIKGKDYSYNPIFKGEVPPFAVKKYKFTTYTKVGEYVMILANKKDRDNNTYYYVNGDTGTVVSCEDKSITVRLERNNRLVRVDYQELIFERAGVKRGHISRPVWKSGYGSTIHKAQGLTLDKVQIVLSRLMGTQHGLLYTALSRVKTKQGLNIVGNYDSLRQSCYVNPNLIPTVD